MEKKVSDKSIILALAAVILIAVLLTKKYVLLTAFILSMVVITVFTAIMFSKETGRKIDDGVSKFIKGYTRWMSKKISALLIYAGEALK